MLLPDAPTVEESGLKDYGVNVWFGLNAPASTPAAAVARINRELYAILTRLRVKKELASDGQSQWPMTPQQYGAFLREEQKRWRQVVHASGATAN